MPERIRLGVVGGGLVAQAMHLPVLARLPERFELRALADPSAIVRTALGERYGIPHRHAEWEALVARADLDAIAICSPHGTHADIARAALHAGRHVFVEKPLSVTVADADEICRLRDATGLVVQVGYMKRFDPRYERLLADLPRDGDLRFIDVLTSDPWMARPPFAPADLVRGDDVPAEVVRSTRERERQQVEQAVGRGDDATVQAFATTYLAAMIHDVNLVQGILEALGRPVPGTPVASRHWADGDGATAWVALEGGAIWSCTWLLLTGVGAFGETVRLCFRDELHELELPAPYTATEAFEREWRHFHDCVVAGAPCRTPPEQGRRDVALLRDLYLA